MNVPTLPFVRFRRLHSKANYGKTTQSWLLLERVFSTRPSSRGWRWVMILAQIDETLMVRVYRIVVTGDFQFITPKNDVNPEKLQARLQKQESEKSFVEHMTQIWQKELRPCLKVAFTDARALSETSFSENHARHDFPAQGQRASPPPEGM